MIRDVPPELADVVRRFEDRTGDVRTRLIRLRAERDDEKRPAERQPDDDFDFDHPVASSIW